MHHMRSRFSGHGPYYEAIALMGGPCNREDEGLDLRHFGLSAVMFQSIGDYLTCGPIHDAKTLGILQEINQICVSGGFGGRSDISGFLHRRVHLGVRNVMQPFRPGDCG